jgi:D-arabinose 1-dehydrogenase-like Zn-dependent alcohol dehydrogenase
MAATPKFNKQDLYDVNGLVAVVTGGSLLYSLATRESENLTLITGGSGLGLIIAQALESHGAKVYITGRNEERLQKAVKTGVSPPHHSK